MKTVTSKNKCPECGGTEWVVWFITSDHEAYIPATSFTVGLIDCEEPGWHKPSLYADECVGCGAVVW